MSKNRPKPASSQFDDALRASAPRAGAADVSPWPAGVRIAVSLFLAWHVFAVFIAPMSISHPSPIARQIGQRPPMQWYINGLYLNHGYMFFAPNPGPGHIIRYVVTDAEGRPLAEGEFPDRSVYWPRLRYHRHFMLADQTEIPFLGLSPQDAQTRVMQGYARHLLREYDGEHARLFRVEHSILSPYEALQGIALDADHKYEVVGYPVDQSRSDLPEQYIQENAPLQSGQAVSRDQWSAGRY